jgi:predicted MFS family arabinose efflux permease
METGKSPRLTVQLGVLTVARLFLNTGIRMMYPFVPALASGLGVGRTDITSLITLRNATGFLSPLFGPLSERYGRKIILAGAMLLFSLGCLIVVIWPQYWVLGITMAVMGVAKVVYDPAMQAYVGDAVPYVRRGRAIAVTEYSWALALLLGAPAVALAIHKWGWQAPFFWLAVLSAAAILFLLWAIPGSRPRNRAVTSIRRSLPFIRQHPVILYAVLYTALIMTANEMLFIVFGGWMVDSFQLDLASLGIAAAVIGGSELIGETFAGWAVDRFGKRPVIITSGLLNAFFYLILPYTSGTLTTALVTLFFIFLTFEVTVVGGMPLMTELVPSGRAVVMSMIFFAASLGRTLGAFIGLLVWDTVGFEKSAIIWATIMVAAIFVLVRWVREGQ